PEGEQVIDEDVANNLASAMQPIAAYSNGHSLAGGRPSAAKSGTTQLGDTGYNKDAWFVGFTPSIATAVWVGTDDNQPLFNAYGGTMYGAGLPADIWKSVMDGALSGTDWEQFPTPGAIGGQAGAPSWESSGSSSDSTYDSYSPDTSSEPEAPVESAPEPAPAPAPAPQAPPLTIQVPGLPEIVIPGAGGPAPAPEPAPAPAAPPGGGDPGAGGGTPGA
ncbi:MAG: penicillin-binding protein, partial [Actinomycetales bacterium]|nr:penicillin-binding protein [Actinomycetales bacterium]